MPQVLASGLRKNSFGAVLDFGLRHHRIEAGPGIDVAADQRGLAVGVLQQHRRDVLFGQAGIEQRAHQEDVRIGAAGHRDALALEVGDGGDLGILGRDQRGPFRARIDIDRLDRIAVDLGDQRRGARGRAEIDRAGVEEFERLVGAGRLHPDDGDAVLGEFLFQQALLLEDHRHRIVGRPVDMDFLQRVGSKAAPGTSIATAMIAAKARREILDIVYSPQGVGTIKADCRKASTRVALPPPRR